MVAAGPSTWPLPPSNATGTRSDGELRPGWSEALVRTLGHHVGTRVVADPAWPALVAAVTTAGEHGWEPADVLTTAHDLLLDSRPDLEPGQTPLRPGELATALAWRVRLLTDTNAHAAHPPAGPSRTTSDQGARSSASIAHEAGFPSDSDAPDEPEDLGEPALGTTDSVTGGEEHRTLRPADLRLDDDNASGVIGVTDDDGRRDTDWLAALTPPEDPLRRPPTGAAPDGRPVGGHAGRRRARGRPRGSLTGAVDDPRPNGPRPDSRRRPRGHRLRGRRLHPRHGDPGPAEHRRVGGGRAVFATAGSAPPRPSP